MDIHSIKSRARCLALLALCLPLAAQPPAPAAEDAYECPMDHDVRSPKPGVCPRCGMTLVPWVADQREYTVKVTSQPAALRAGRPARLFLELLDPATGTRVKHLREVHTKLLHLFLVSGDLQWFAHEHPVLDADHRFHLDVTLPKPGLYRLLTDFYPAGGTPQLAPQTLLAEGVGPVAHLNADLQPKDTANLRAELVTEPAIPLAGQTTRLFLRVRPDTGLQPYLGAWAHLLAASDDLIDLIHEHPWIATGGPEMQFNLVFPRARNYRLWIQLQRNGVVNTAVFTVPVKNLD